MHVCVCVCVLHICLQICCKYIKIVEICYTNINSLKKINVNLTYYPIEHIIFTNNEIKHLKIITKNTYK